MLEVGSTLHGFVVQSAEDLPEIDGRAYVMRHGHSGARLLYMANDDENKAFSIAFKTPPADDTGVFHILEHSVLCGSDRFPVKEPFVNLLKTSMQTFLNALTFPDKTMYPVASTNMQDLLNLMDVYLDAVFHPLIYSNPLIFAQEGWHYEVVPDEAGGRRLVYNGVVFNEMKGALSSPESVLFRTMNHTLFPGTPYAFESGGDPRAIPTLTYADFIDAHARHYNAANSYITLYGRFDDQGLDAALALLDDGYLGQAQPPKANPNAFAPATPVVADVVEQMDTAPENACVGLGYVVGSSHDYERLLAIEILSDALFGGNESPIKRAILDAGIGGDVVANLIDSQQTCAFSLMLMGAQPGVTDTLKDIVEREARRLSDQGIPRDALEAAFEQLAFSLRERDFGMADGVVLSMTALSGWLYSDDDVTTYLRYEQPLAHLREGLDSRYFEDLLASVFLDNPHRASVTLQPAPTGAAAEEAAELARDAAAMGEEQLDAIEAQVEALRAHQEAPDAHEDLAKLPQLHVSDIGPAKPYGPFALVDDGPLPYLHHDLPTHGICYLCHYFDLGDVDYADLPYAAILALLLGELDTSQHTAAQLDVYKRCHLGALRCFIDTHANCNDTGKVTAKFVVEAAALSENLGYLADIPREVWSDTLFDDAGRVRDLLVQRRIGFEQMFITDGTSCAKMRACAHVSPEAALREVVAGVDFYLFLRELLDDFDNRFDALRAKLAQVSQQVFTGKNYLASFTGSDADRRAFWRQAGDLGLAGGNNGQPDAGRSPCQDGLPCGFLARSDVKALPPANEAFVVPSDIVFTARVLRMQADHAAVGAWRVAAGLLSYDYLWNEVRVKGGAYGCGFSCTPSGLARFSSYRDPHIASTFERFDATPAWLASLDLDDDAMQGYIVSTVASHDAPAKPRAIARNQDAAYFSGWPAGWRETVRGQILAVTPDALRALAAKLQSGGQPVACVFGNGDIIEGEGVPFDTVTQIL